MAQVNHKTKAEYAGANADTLAHEQMSKGYKLNEWLTFIQAKELGLRIKKGEKGTQIVRVIEEENIKGQIGKFVRVYTVFNIEQTKKAGA